MRYAYPCNILRDKEEERLSGREAYTVTFPDVYGANTGGWSWQEAVDRAKDCLEVALGMYVKAGEDIPAPSPLEKGQVPISVAPVVAAQLAGQKILSYWLIFLAGFNAHENRNDSR